jgi:hypothetical protein
MLESPEVIGIREDPHLSPLQKSEKAREVLNKMKNPRYWAWRESVEKSVRRLGLPPKTGIRMSPFFETDEMTLVLSFETAEEFRRGIEELDKRCRGKDFDALFRDPEDFPE